MEKLAHGKLPALEEHLKRLFIASLEGGEQPYANFLQHLARYLRGYFGKRMQACPDQAEDLVQDVLMAVHLKKHTYDENLPISSWIHAIAKYKYIDFLRRRRFEVNHELLNDADELFSSEGDLVNESKIDIEKLLLALPDAFRLPIQLTKLDGHTVKEASKISGMSESAIKIGVHRGLKKLATTLGCRYEH